MYAVSKPGQGAGETGGGGTGATEAPAPVQANVLGPVHHLPREEVAKGVEATGKANNSKSKSKGAGAAADAKVVVGQGHSD